MGLRADTADAIGKHWHVFDRTPHAESLKAAQFGDLEVGVGDVALIVQEDLDLAVSFESGDGVDRYTFRHGFLPPVCVRSSGLEQRACHAKAVKRPGRINDAIEDAIDLFRVLAVDHGG